MAVISVPILAQTSAKRSILQIKTTCLQWQTYAIIYVLLASSGLSPLGCFRSTLSCCIYVGRVYPSIERSSYR